MKFLNNNKDMHQHHSGYFHILVGALWTSAALMGCGTGTTPGGTGPDTSKQGVWKERGVIARPVENQNGRTIRIATSSDTKFVVAGISPGHVYTSEDFGQTWNDRSPATGTGSGNQPWKGFWSSADGGFVAGVVGGGRIFILTNPAKGWAEVSPSTGSGSGDQSWTDIAASSNNERLVATSAGPKERPGGHIYTSKNSGDTWEDSSPTTGDASGPLQWKAVTSSSDGKYLAAVTVVYYYNNVSYPGHIYTSDDYGASWKDRSLTNNTIKDVPVWYSIDSSTNGQYLIASAGWNDQTTATVKFYTSDNMGATWTDRTPEELNSSSKLRDMTGGDNVIPYLSHAYSSDGTKIALLVSGKIKSYLFTSANNGVKWTIQTLPEVPSTVKSAYYLDIASSTDGSSLIIVRSEAESDDNSLPARFRFYSVSFN